MTHEELNTLLPLLRSAIDGALLTDGERAALEAADLQRMMAFAEKQDLGHLLPYALERNGMKCPTPAMEQTMFAAVYRYQQMQYALDTVTAALEEAGIDFLPLKGAVLRAHYPEPWMRTSGDLDILVREEEVDRAAAYLVEHCGCTDPRRGSHDVTLYTKNRVHIELHYTLMEEDLAKTASEVLQEVFAHTVLRDGWSHWRLLDAETFYFYHIAHLAKHFERGGSGIRSFMDLWIMEKCIPLDPAARDALLEKGGLRTFSEASVRLSKVWFEQEPMDAVSARMEEYVLRGGVYGARENRIAVEQERRGGRWAYLRSKIFLTHEDLKYQYPVLCKHRWLTPLMQVRRWCRLAFCGHAKRSLREIRYSAGLSREELKETARFMQSIGL